MLHTSRSHRKDLESKWMTHAHNTSLVCYTHFGLIERNWTPDGWHMHITWCPLKHSGPFLNEGLQISLYNYNHSLSITQISDNSMYSKQLCHILLWCRLVCYTHFVLIERNWTPDGCQLNLTWCPLKHSGLFFNRGLQISLYVSNHDLPITQNQWPYHV